MCRTAFFSLLKKDPVDVACHLGATNNLLLGKVSEMSRSAAFEVEAGLHAAGIVLHATNLRDLSSTIHELLNDCILPEHRERPVPGSCLLSLYCTFILQPGLGVEHHFLCQFNNSS